tara:strand:+ start:921 stop:2042 length:1122 start_codon:yes stop_codon:yes gene_type:complete
MSTLKVETIRHNSATSDAITTHSDGTCTARLTGMTSGGGFSHKNMIINGDMLVDQRGDLSTTNSNLLRQYGGPDRFHQYYYQSDETARYDFKHGGTGVSPVEQGFSRTAILDVTTAQTSVTAGQAIWTSQRIEANNASHLKFGSSDAESVTLSFWIKSSVTGIYTIMLNHTNMDERYITTYTVNNADTWEKKTITFPGDTRSGKTIAATNGYGLEVKWVWMAGSSRVATPNEWATQGNKYGASGVTLANIFSSTSNNLYLTGVQLEVGDTATSFEHRNFGDEFLRCARYYYKQTNVSIEMLLSRTGGRRVANVYFPVPMRTTPTVTINTAFTDGGASISPSSVSIHHYKAIQNSSSANGSAPNFSDWEADAEL